MSKSNVEAEKPTVDLTPEIVAAVLQQISDVTSGDGETSEFLGRYIACGGRDMAAANLVQRLGRSERAHLALLSHFKEFVSRTYRIGGTVPYALRLGALKVLCDCIEARTLDVADERDRNDVLDAIEEQTKSEGQTEPMPAARAWAAIATCAGWVHWCAQEPDAKWELEGSVTECAVELARAFSETSPECGDAFIQELRAFVEQAENEARRSSATPSVKSAAGARVSKKHGGKRHAA